MRSLKSLFGRVKEDSAGTRDFLLNKMPGQSVCAEIGVYRGDFSQRILDIVAPRTLHLIDPWKFQSSEVYVESLYGGQRGANQASMDSIYESVVQRFKAQIQSGLVVLHRATSTDAAATFPDNYFDWIYIDGDHQYAFVKEDLHAYFPKVKNGGCVAGDDYGSGGWWKGGVKTAVDEFATEMAIGPVQTRSRQFWFRKDPA